MKRILNSNYRSLKLITKANLLVVAILFFTIEQSMAQGGPPNNPGPPQNSYWNLQGNVVDEAEHFFGATNLAPLVFKTNDQERFRIDENGQIIFPDFANLGKGLLYSDNGNLLFHAFTGEKDRSLRADGTFAPVSWMRVGDDIYSLNEGNVGIGTTNPLGKLHVADGDVYFENQVYVGERITVMGRVRSDDTLRMEADYLQAASCSRAELGERVGIGRVPSDTYALDVNGDVRFTGEITAASIQFSEPFSVDQFVINEQLQVGNTIYLNGAIENDENEDPWDEITTSNGVLAIGKASFNGEGIWETGGVIPNNNHVKVGIGTNQPQKALHVFTDHYELQDLPHLGSHHGIRLEDFSANGTSLWDLEPLFEDGVSYFSIGNGEEQGLLSILEDGNVGIGTVAPEAKLHVMGDAIVTGKLTANELNITEPLVLENLTVSPQLRVGNSVFINGEVPEDPDIDDPWDEITSSTGVLAFAKSDEEGYGSWNSHFKVGFGTNEPQKALHIRTMHGAEAMEPDKKSHHGMRLEEYNTTGIGQTVAYHSIWDIEPLGNNDHTYLKISSYNPDADENEHIFAFSETGGFGIGTTSPEEYLHIHNDAEETAFMKFTNSNHDTETEGFKLGVGEDGSGQIIQEHNTPMRFKVRGEFAGSELTESMTLYNNGRVGFGAFEQVNCKVTINAEQENGLCVYTNKTNPYGWNIRTHVNHERTKAFSVVYKPGEVDIENFIVYGDGTVYARKFYVTEDFFPDYVFEKDYKLMSLQELEAYIESNNKLPNMPSAEQVKEEGADMGEIQRVSVEKIEELTLHIIEMNKRLEKLEEENEKLKEELEDQQ